MQLYFFGAGVVGQEALKKCNDIYQGNRIIFIDNNKACKVDFVSVVPLECVPTEAQIVITVSSPFQIKQIYLQLKSAGYKNIFWYMRKNRVKKNLDFLSAECQRIEDWGQTILPQAEMHVSDWCNLNCRGCTHFSPIFEKNFPDIEDRIKDVQAMKEKFSHIIKFFMLGGEPFLNPEIGQYITRIREILPKTDLWIVSNGLLIPSLDEEILEAMRANYVAVSISEYEPTHRIINSIIKRLEKFCIDYNIRPYDRKQKFNLPLSTSSQSIHEHMCISNGCVNIYNGKIARCPTLMYIDRFNEKFGTDLPNNGIFPLDNNMSGEVLLQRLEEEVPLCRHCIKNEIEWERCGKDTFFSDFAIGD